MNEWALIIRTFRLSEHTQGPTSSDNRGTTVLRNSNKSLSLCGTWHNVSLFVTCSVHWSYFHGIFVCTKFLNFSK